MDIISGVFLTTALAVAVVLIVTHCRCGQLTAELWRHERIQNTIDHLLLRRMLRRLRIPYHRYATAYGSDDIEAHIENCRQCPNVAHCREVLSRGASLEQLSFCPNRDALLALRSEPKNPG